MEIVLLDSRRWAVVAPWLGATRVVFRGSLFEAIRFVREAAS